jgi:hypothetical protein
VICHDQVTFKKSVLAFVLGPQRLESGCPRFTTSCQISQAAPMIGYTHHEQPKTGFADVMQSVSTQNDKSNRKNASNKPAEYRSIKAAGFE